MINDCMFQINTFGAKKTILWPRYTITDARRRTSFQTKSQINSVYPLITSRFNPVCTLYALISHSGLRAFFCQIHNFTPWLFHYIGRQVRSSLFPNVKWFISALSMSTTAARDLQSLAIRSLPGKDWHFRAERRDVLYVLAALWS